MSSESAETTRIRPLKARPGAGFKCSGNGFCCSDIHLLGGLTRTDRRRLRIAAPHARFERDGEFGLRTKNGRCELLDERGACSVHAQKGFDSKPTCCRRFPFDLVATPTGGRIVTAHLCPCRTLGRGEPLAVDLAEAALRDPAGRLTARERIGVRVRMSRGTSVSFTAYEALEGPLIERLARGERPLPVDTLEAPGMGGIDWGMGARHLLRHEGTTVYDVAIRCFGHALSRHDLAGSPRPWGAYFEGVALERSDDDARGILGDWLADEVWSLAWTAMPAYSFGLELQARCLAAEWYVAERRRLGASDASAAAEAVFLGELVGQSEPWRAFLRDALPRATDAARLFVKLQPGATSQEPVR